MSESISGLYSALIASTRASYGHDRGVVPSSKLAHFLAPIGAKKLCTKFLRAISTGGD